MGLIWLLCVGFCLVLAASGLIISAFRRHQRRACERGIIELAVIESLRRARLAVEDEAVRVTSLPAEFDVLLRTAERRIGDSERIDRLVGIDPAGLSIRRSMARMIARPSVVLASAGALVLGIAGVIWGAPVIGSLRIVPPGPASEQQIPQSLLGQSSAQRAESPMPEVSRSSHQQPNHTAPPADQTSTAASPTSSDSSARFKAKDDRLGSVVLSGIARSEAVGMAVEIISRSGDRVAVALVDRDTMEAEVDADLRVGSTYQIYLVCSSRRLPDEDLALKGYGDKSVRITTSRKSGCYSDN